MIDSAVAFSFSYGLQEVDEVLAPLINAKSETYGFDQGEAMKCD